MVRAGVAALPGIRLAALVDPAGPPPEHGLFDAVFTNAYAAGRPDCFVQLQPGRGDHLFAARLLLDGPSVAVEPLTPADPLERELASYWTRRSAVVPRDRLWAAVAARLHERLERAAGTLAVFTADAGGALARALRARGAPVFGAETVKLLSPRFGRTLFIIGNTPADGKLIKLLRRFGGDVALTSACLLAAYDEDDAARLAAAELGRAVPATELQQWRDGIGRPAALWLGEVADAARALFVPSAWLAGEIAARYGRAADLLPLPAGTAPETGDGIAAAAAGLHAEACVWAVELLRFWGSPVRLRLDCPAAERPALAALAERLGVAGQIAFGPGAGAVAVVLAMRGGVAREAALAAAAARNCVASRCLAETIGAPAWVRVVPDQPSAPLLAAAMRDALAAPPPDAAAWRAAHAADAVAAYLA